MPDAAAPGNGSPPRPSRARWPIALPLSLLVLLVLTWALTRPATRPDNAVQTTGYRVDLNQADAAELALLPGVGPITAQRIAAYREQHGRFTDFEQLKAVHGLGDKTVARFAPYATLGFVETIDTSDE